MVRERSLSFCSSDRASSGTVRFSVLSEFIGHRLWVAASTPPKSREQAAPSSNADLWGARAAPPTAARARFAAPPPAGCGLGAARARASQPPAASPALAGYPTGTAPGCFHRTQYRSSVRSFPGAPDPVHPMRPSKRKPDELRRVSIERAVSMHAEGSCLIKFGNTHVHCTASLEERMPPWLKGQGRGWVTAEYGMLPRATTDRTRREATAGHPSGRTQEIQRLIGRALRAVVDLPKLGERQISIDCDVIQADGGTRTAAITGAWVALHDCLKWMQTRDMVREGVLRDHVAAVSCGLYKGTAVLDLDYPEDSGADADANFVMTGSGGIVEVQGTAETLPFTQEGFDQLMALARKGIAELIELQKLTVA